MLPEDLMLLLIDEQSGRVRIDSTSLENALGGAVLIELVNSGRVEFQPNGKKLQVVDPTPKAKRTSARLRTNPKFS